MAEPLSMAALLSALQGLFKVEASVIKAQEASLIKTGDISAIKEIKELKMSLIDMNNQIQHLTINIVAGGRQVNIFGNNSDNPPLNNNSYEQQQDAFLPSISSDGESGTASPHARLQRSMIDIPLETGLHLMVNNFKWLSQNRPFQVNNQYVLVPVNSDGVSALIVDILESDRVLSMNFKDASAQIMLNWPMDICENLPYGGSISLNNSEWCLHELPIEQSVSLSNDRSQLISFAPEIVSRVWMLVRTHLAKIDPRPVQRFLFVMRKS